ncbi:hypothetical protein [Burkholderia sp. 9120]|uniref:hypothetical protein n=1 Tax=Burkholderia sp. 9120 TaxID=1500897 RepID=UPI000551CFA5|nr:hypothetical protein [Burkholderia sp. 9120]
MPFLKFRLNTDEQIALYNDVETFIGGKPIGQPVQLPDYPKTTTMGDRLLFGYEIDEGFLEAFPRWQSKLEH